MSENEYEEVLILIDDNDSVFQKISEWLSKIEVKKVGENSYKVRFLTDPIHYGMEKARNQIVGYLCWQLKMYLLELEGRESKEKKRGYVS